MYQSDRFGINKRKKHSERASYANQEAKKNSMSLKRARVQIETVVIGEGIRKFDALMILSELTPTQVLLFSEATFTSEQQVVVHIPGATEAFKIKGAVTACKEIPVNYGIISQKAFNHRVEISFIYDNEGSAQKIMDYYLALRASDSQSA